MFSASTACRPQCLGRADQPHPRQPEAMVPRCGGQQSSPLPSPPATPSVIPTPQPHLRHHRHRDRAATPSAGRRPQPTRAPITAGAEGRQHRRSLCCCARRRTCAPAKPLLLHVPTSRYLVHLTCTFYMDIRALLIANTLKHVGTCSY